jgi:hypothetical protein
MTNHETDAGALVALARQPDGAALTDAQRVQIDTMVAGVAADSWFRTYGPSRNPMSLKEGTAIASVILDACEAGRDAEQALIEAHLLTQGDAWYHARELARELTERHDDDLIDLTRREHSALLQALAERIEPALGDADPSTPRDALSGHDRAEVVFVFSPRGKPPLDGAIVSNRPWPAFEELTVNDGLAHALACMGYTVGQYRKASGNRRAAERGRGKMRLARADFARREEPICTWDAVREMVDNACATHFVFCAYAIVSVEQLIDLDPTKPFTLSKAAIATWNPWSGTFHDAVNVLALALLPAMGTLIAPAHLHSPDQICGFVHSYYEAEISQALG